MRKWALQWFHCITPLHVGAGQGLGAIDRPVAREAASDYPFVYSSTQKGAFRAIAEKEWAIPDDEATRRRKVNAAFGSEGSENEGCMSFVDAALIALPVRSMAGTFAMCTSPLALATLHRKLAMAGGQEGEVGKLSSAIVSVLEKFPFEKRGVALGASSWPPPHPDPTAAAAVPAPPWDSVISFGPPEIKYCIEGLILDCVNTDSARTAMAELAFRMVSQWFGDDESFWKKYLAARLLLVDDTSFSHLVLNATQVDPGIKIAGTGTTEIGSLRYTEYLPSETVLASIVASERPFMRPDPPENETAIDALWDKVRNEYKKTADRYLQLGGDETKGKGIVRSRFVPLAGWDDPVPTMTRTT